MKKRGLLLTLTEPPAGMEEEFNAWYDEEHLPERLAIPGFRSAQRWVADVRPGEGKYLATYELDGPEVLTSPQYLSFFERPKPWTRRCLGKPAAKALVLNIAATGALQVRRFAASNGEQVSLSELSESALQKYPGLAYRVYKP